MTRRRTGENGTPSHDVAACFYQIKFTRCQMAERTERQIVLDGAKNAAAEFIEVRGDIVLRVIGKNASPELRKAAKEAGRLPIAIKPKDLIAAIGEDDPAEAPVADPVKPPTPTQPTK
jgi:hypothetical protein